MGCCQYDCWEFGLSGLMVSFVSRYSRAHHRAPEQAGGIFTGPARRLPGWSHAGLDRNGNRPGCRASRGATVCRPGLLTWVWPHELYSCYFLFLSIAIFSLIAIFSPRQISDLPCGAILAFLVGRYVLRIVKAIWYRGRNLVCCESWLSLSELFTGSTGDS